MLTPEKPLATRLRRFGKVAFHVLLALWATPLPGACSVAWRMASQLGRRQAIAYSLAAAATVLIGLSLAFWAPLSTTAAMAVVGLVWAAGGLLNGYWDRPSLSDSEVTRPASPGSHALLWSAALPVAALPFALLLAAIATRWGTAVYAKPSVPLWILLVAFAVFVPLGGAVGIVRYLLGRPLAPHAPVVLATAAPCVLVSLGVMELLHSWLREDLLELTSGGEAPGGDLWLPFLAIVIWLSESRQVSHFMQRWASATGVSLLVLFNVDLMSGSWPLAVAQERAVAASVRGDHTRSAAHWRWYVRRAAVTAAATHGIAHGTREALLAEDWTAARGMVAPLGADFTSEIYADPLLLIRDSLDRPSGERPEVYSVEIKPVRDEDYLSPSWGALLTAIRTARPELSESSLKSRLRAISYDVATLQLPWLNSFDLLRLVAAHFDCRVVTRPFERRHELLEIGSAVLALDASGNRWLVSYWSAPEAESSIWLDYGRWSAELEGLASAELSGQEVDSGPRVLAHLGTVQAEEWWRHLHRRDPRPAFGLIPAEASDSPQTVPEDPGLIAFSRLWRARDALSYDAPSLALELVAALPASPQRNEILALIHLDPVGRTRLGAERQEQALALAETLISEDGLSRASPFALEHLAELSGVVGSLRCSGLEESLLRHRSALDPGAYFEDRLRLARRLGDPEEVAALARDLARAQSWESGAVLRALNEVTALDEAGQHPATREVLHSLLERLPLLPSLAGEPRPRGTWPSYCAARAVLAEEPAEAARWWRRAAELDPTKPIYFRRLAESLGTSQDEAAARWAATQAESLAGIPECAAPEPLPARLEESHAR